MLLAISFALLYFCGTCSSAAAAAAVAVAVAAEETSCPNNAFFSGTSQSASFVPETCKDMSKTVITMSYGRSGSRYIAEVLDRILIGELM